MYLTVVKKVRFGNKIALSCSSYIASRSYSWTKDGVPITAETSGVASDTIYTNNLTITSMTQQLVGIYQCLLNDIMTDLFDVKIVGMLIN